MIVPIKKHVRTWREHKVWSVATELYGLPDVLDPAFINEANLEVQADGFKRIFKQLEAASDRTVVYFLRKPPTYTADQLAQDLRIGLRVGGDEPILVDCTAQAKQVVLRSDVQKDRNEVSSHVPQKRLYENDCSS